MRPDLQAQEDYWRAHLSGELPVLDIGSDHPRPPVQAFTSATETLELGIERLEALRRLAAAESVSPFVVMLAALDVVLLRLTGQEDVIVGSVVTDAGGEGSERPERVNVVALRTDLTGDSDLRSLLRRVSATVAGASAHRHYPFHQVVECVGADRDPSRAPVFQVMLVPVDGSSGVSDAAVEEEDLREVGEHIARCDLVFLTSATTNGLSLLCRYDSMLFEASRIRRLLDSLGCVIEATADPGRSLSTLPLWTNAERDGWLAEANDTARPYPRHACLHELFEAQAAERPEAVAVVSSGGSLSFGALNRLANGLAHRLRRQGVRPETRVGICVERSPQMVVGLLGILKAGGAYVPLDPSHPPIRLAALVRDAGVSLVVTQPHLLDSILALDVPAVCVDGAAPALTPAEAGNPDSGAAPESLAYVMYTSGSTGRPKGVGVPHRAVVRLVKAADYARLTADEVFLQLAPLAFDASTFEIWGSLLNGARLVIFPAGPPTPEALAETVTRHRVTTLWLTAGLFHELVDRQLAGLAPVRQLLAGGDVLSGPHVARVLRELPHCHLINGYGPTEATTFTCCGRLTLANLGSSVAIGRPIANTRVFLLDGRLEPVPIGATGELHVAGDGLARGYLDRPDLTAETFIPDPWSAEPGGRMYRTGDLARYRPDGVIEFLGRRDRQVKILGFRVEPGEIEAALAQHPAVKHALVMLREDRPGDRRLVAYVVCEAGGAVSPAALRGFLRTTLPEYLVPAAFVAMEALPLTPSGKVDRRALPVADLSAAPPDGAFVAPRTEIETALARLWAQALGRSRVAVHDNFFDLGGHSLLAVQALARIRQAFEIDLALHDFFAHPTVAEMAPVILQRLVADPRQSAGRALAEIGAPPGADPGTVELERAIEALSPEQRALLERRLHAARSGPARSAIPPWNRSAPSPLSFAQQRLWFLHQLEPDSSAYHIPQAFRLLGALDLAALRAALDAIVARHETLRTRIAVRDGLPARTVAEPGAVELVMRDLAECGEAEREGSLRREIEAAARRPFDLAADPMLRATLFRLAPDEHVLLLVLHHIAADGWSLQILNRELAALYTAHASGRLPTLPPLAIQYADYAGWQRQQLDGERLAAQVAYWTRQLRGAPPALALLTDRPRPPWLASPGARRTGSIAPALTGALRALGQREGVTLFMVLLAAFQTLLHRHSGQDDIVVGSPTAGRMLVETEGLIGFFVNTLALRTDLRGDPTFRALLARVRETALAAFAHQDLPFEKLVEELRPERTLSRTPIFQVMFALQNAPRTPLALPGLTVVPLPVEPAVAKFDLVLDVTEEGGGLTTVIEYNADLFDAATIDGMGRQFGTLLEGIVADPGRPLSGLSLLTAGERRRMFHAGDGGRRQAAGVCVHTLFEGQAERTPEAVAVVLDDRRLTYRELNARANRLAHHLRGYGVGPDVRVALSLDRSLEMVVGLLGILKAGGAYVPLDPHHPTARREFVLEDTGAPVLLTSEPFHEGPLPDRVRLVSLDGGGAALAGAAVANPQSGAGPRNLAYVIYTSGSTGAPKGVMVEHGSVVSYLAWVNAHLLPDPDECLPAVTSVTFDASLKQLLAPLVRGGQVWLLPDAVAMDPARLLRAVGARSRVALNCVPSLWRSMLDEIDAGRAAPPAGLRRLLLGGEAVDQALLERSLARWPDLEIRNLYGPTEATANATMAVLAAGALVTIGRPITPARVHVLDRALEPVPVGVAGELYIGGAGVARGYLGRPELTAEAFIPDPLGAEPGARLYATGDRVRYRPDGAIEFLGRLDHQVKLRGLRVEPGEIGAALERHPFVRQAVVAMTGDEIGQRLVAYVVPGPDGLPSPAELRALVRAALPVSLMPAAFVFLDALPLTSSGKVDRRALLALAPEPERPPDAAVAPGTPLEALLTSTWSEVLERGAVGIHDNFFDAGGHSLLAVKIAARITDALQMDVPVRWIFETPTVAGLAARIEAMGSNG